MPEKIIEVSDLFKSYHGFAAVSGLNFEVYPGDVYGFLGPNGAGKSTTIRMLLSLVRPDSGSIRLFGRTLQSGRSDILRRIGCIVEKPDFYKFLSAEKNLDVFGRLSGIRVTRNRISEVLELVGLQGREKDVVKAYSHGMKQRLGLAQALLHDPELIVLDEPTTGLDPKGIIDIRNLILHLSRDLNKTVLLSSHILSEIELIANRMVIINKGKAVVEGNVSELLSARELVVEFSVDDAARARELISHTSWQQQLQPPSGNTLVFHIGMHQVPLVNKLLCENGIAVSAIGSKKKLEDYFLTLMEKN